MRASISTLRCVPTRLTNAFSKKLANPKPSVALPYAHYNFAASIAGYTQPRAPFASFKSAVSKPSVNQL